MVPLSFLPKALGYFVVKDHFLAPVWACQELRNLSFCPIVVKKMPL